MTREDHAVIRAGYLDGDTAEQIAADAGVTLAEVETYLTWWCSEGCPET